jgi:hypothetical protein
LQGDVRGCTAERNMMDSVLTDGFYFEAGQVMILSETYNKAITKFVPGTVVDHQTELRLVRLILNVGRGRIIAGRERCCDQDAKSVATIAFWQRAKRRCTDVGPSGHHSSDVLNLPPRVTAAFCRAA